jgi:hypothetical protein
MNDEPTPPMAIGIYQLQGLPQTQIDRIQKLGLFTGNRMGWVLRVVHAAVSELPAVHQKVSAERLKRRGMDCTNESRLNEAIAAQSV